MMHEMCTAAIAGEVRRAREVNARLMPLHKALFVEANPIPVKWAAQQLGLIDGGIRLPLTPFSSNYHELVRNAMRHAELTA
jgi:4-hydroxy-tetrahydrodipicolinate synthase